MEQRSSLFTVHFHTTFFPADKQEYLLITIIQKGRLMEDDAVISTQAFRASHGRGESQENGVLTLSVL